MRVQVLTAACLLYSLAAKTTTTTIRAAAAAAAVQLHSVTPSPRGVLYARQKEFVLSWPGERFADGLPVKLLGTEDVLTCHVIILHHKFTQVTGLAHFDEYIRDRGLNRFVNAFLDRVRRNHYSYDDDDHEDSDDWEWVDCDEGQQEDGAEEIDLSEDLIELHLVGGYDDEAKKAHRLSLRLLGFFHAHSQNFQLRTCCIGSPNTRPARCKVGHREPIVGGVAARIADGVPFPAGFNRHFVASQVDEDLQRTLLLGPSLVRKPFKLKELILKKEDEGYNNVDLVRAT